MLPAMPKSKAAPTKKQLADAHVDPATKDAYEALLAEIADADRDEKHGWDRKYEAIGEVLDKKLFLLSAHGTAQRWCAATLGETYRSVVRNVRVARYCSPEDEHDYGTAKLDAVLTYLDARTHGLNSGGLKVSLKKLRIPVVEGKKTRQVPLAEATVQQITAAARREQAGSKRSRRSPIEAAFAAPLAGDRDLREVRVRVSDSKLSFGGVPLSALDRFLKAVKGVDWEAALPK